MSWICRYFEMTKAHTNRHCHVLFNNGPGYARVARNWNEEYFHYPHKAGLHVCALRRMSEMHMGYVVTWLLLSAFFAKYGANAGGTQMHACIDPFLPTPSDLKTSRNWRWGPMGLQRIPIWNNYWQLDCRVIAIEFAFYGQSCPLNGHSMFIKWNPLMAIEWQFNFNWWTWNGNSWASNASNGCSGHYRPYGP